MDDIFVSDGRSIEEIRADVIKELPYVQKNISGVFESDSFDTYYDEDGVALLDVFKHRDNEKVDKVCLWFHMSDKKYVLPVEDFEGLGVRA